jgi:hypothetical protein
MRRTTAALALLVLPLAGCGGGSHAAAKGTALTGLLTVTKGSCAAATATGSWFKMATAGGTADKGPFVTNADSGCTDKTVTSLVPGTDGGLRTGAYQAQPTPVFDAKGNSLSKAIVGPVRFFAVDFGVATNAKDPQTGTAAPAPSVTVDGSTLTADLSSWGVSWNGQHFNQGSPKPGASGAKAIGTYDAATGAYTLQWTSLIKGGPFNGFTGIWHLEGTVRKS